MICSRHRQRTIQFQKQTKIWSDLRGRLTNPVRSMLVHCGTRRLDGTGYMISMNSRVFKLKVCRNLSSFIYVFNGALEVSLKYMIWRDMRLFQPSNNVLRAILIHSVTTTIKKADVANLDLVVVALFKLKRINCRRLNCLARMRRSFNLDPHRR